MSNQCIIEVRHFDDDVLVLVEDGYGKTFLSFEPDYFDSQFPDVPSLLRKIASTDEMDGAFWVEEDGNVVLECCSSLELHGFIPDDDSVVIYLRSDQE
jgi:hypothetical protein